MKVTIHCEPRIAWQPRRAAYFVEGFRKAGVQCAVTERRERQEGLPILLGTSCWRAIEQDGGDYLLVDRCSFGDTDTFVQLVRNGHGRRGDHRVPENFNGERWERYGQPFGAWKGGERVVLCGQTETYSHRYRSLEEWYGSVRATHFRPHPAGSNPTGLAESRDFDNAIALTLNSSIGVQCVIAGIPTITMDEGAMAWDVTGHRPDEIRMPERREWAHWLAWTQYTDDEVREGSMWDRLL